MRLRNLLLIVPTIFVTVCFVVFPKEISESIKASLLVCADTLIPTLLPFLVLSNFVARSGLINSATKLFAPLTNFLFNLPSCAFGVFISSITGGYPVGPSMVQQLLDSNDLNDEQAQKLALFSISAGPAFIIGAVGYGMLGSTRIGLLLYLSVVLSSLITGIIVCRNLKSRKPEPEHIKSPLPLGAALSRSVDSGTKGILTICSYFVVCSAVFETVLVVCQEFCVNPELILTVIEVTKGSKIICELNLSYSYLLPLLAAAISFGGVCVHCQISDSLRALKLSYGRFLKARLLSALISAVIMRTIVLLAPKSALVFSNISHAVNADFSMSFISLSATFLMAALLILDLDIKRDLC